MSVIENLHKYGWATNILESLIFICLVLAIRAIANLFVEKQLKSTERKLRWKINLRNASVVLLILGLFIIWGTELRTLALSLVAFAVALILATKEIIMCITGTIFKAISRPFAVGDQIIVGDYRGEVIDQTLLSTTLIEIGPGKEMHQQTGRAITLPNSIFVTSAVVNESFRQDYVLHGFSIPINLNSDWQKKENLLLETAKQVCEPFYQEARKQLIQTAKSRSVDVPSIEPRVSIRIQEPEKATLLIRVPAPVRQRGKIEQEILHRYLTLCG